MQSWKTFRRRIFLSFGRLKHVIAFGFGWVIAGQVLFLPFWKHSDFTLKDSVVPVECPCDHQRCQSCPKFVDIDDDLIRRNKEIQNSFYRSYCFKSRHAGEDLTRRWRYLTLRHHYEMLNQEPRIGLNGMWKKEVQKVEQFATGLAACEGGEDGGDKYNMLDMFRQEDPFCGLRYIVNCQKSGDDKELRTVELQRPFLSGKPLLTSVEFAGDDQLINVISPLSKVSERFDQFLSRYERQILGADGARSGPLRTVFVVFRNRADGGADAEHTLHVIDEFRARNPRAAIVSTLVTGDFNRAIGLHTGVQMCGDDEIVLFLDVDLSIGPGFLHRLRRNAVRGERVVFPIMYSQYDPSVMDQAAQLEPKLAPMVADKAAINKHTGFWIYYAYGVAAMYKSDYLKIGGFRLDIRGWGGEDVDLFKKAVADPDLHVMSTVDRDLVHIYHTRGCDPRLEPGQYAMCIGAWAETLGSQLELAVLYGNAKRLLLP